MSCLPEGVAIISDIGDIVYTNKSLHRIPKATRESITEKMMNL